MEQINIIDPYEVTDHDGRIKELYENFLPKHTLSFSERVVAVSKLFLGRPYVLSALGEGLEGLYDQRPLYRLDVFDCVTFVNTVLSIVKAYDLQSFKKYLIKYAYMNGEVSYFTRNHFMSCDWNVNNAQQGLVRDITSEIAGEDNIKIAATTIDKPAWFEHHGLGHIHLASSLDRYKQQTLLQDLKALATKARKRRIETSYLPIPAMFDAQKKPIKTIFERFPDVCLIEIVRPDWNVKSKIGTNMNVSHVGFAIRDYNTGRLILRHASQVQKCVVDVSLQEYLLERLPSPTIKGINIQALL